MAASAPLPSVVMRLKRLLWDHQRSLVVWNAEIETATGLTFKIKMIIPVFVISVNIIHARCGITE